MLLSWYFLGYVVFGYVYAVWYLPRVRAWDADQNPNKLITKRRCGVWRSVSF